MPSSLFADCSVHGDALHIALEQLSLLGLAKDDNPLDGDSREPRKNPVNMTECVPVPSSEHVAEIVGRQGCKIKALRAKTNTYIKTPVRGEEPVFVVTGRREDVAMARREIISAAEHFSMIRASRNKNTSISGSAAPVAGAPNLPGHTTIQVRVPYRVVGLVVGPKGATIKRIQQQTHTYIVTPSRDKEPVFEVTGMPENVDRAREEMEAHIAVRTGALVQVRDDNDFHANGTDVGFDLNGQPAPWSKRSVGMACESFSKCRHDSSSSLGSASTDSYFASNSRLADCGPPGPALSCATSNTSCNNDNDMSVSTDGNGFVCGTEAMSPDCTDLTFEPPPGLGEASPTQTSVFWSRYEDGMSPVSTPDIFPANSSGVMANQRRRRRKAARSRMSPPLHTGPNERHFVPRLCTEPSEDLLLFPGDVNAVGALTSSHLPCLPRASSSSSSSSSSASRDCSVCFESEVIAALVPCGHNLFCLDCANRICEQSQPQCPVCHAAVSQAIRIFS